ncbi:MAG: hypothetical protein IPP47_17340 [Bryobacterales bacterium]|nr:hypothetical protein [Bryobacterales bacterium]
MQQKTITVLIDEKGNSSIDLEGFAGHGCDKVLNALQGNDRVKIERKKPAFFTEADTAQGQQIKASR